MSRSEVRLSQVVVVDNQPQQYLQFVEAGDADDPRVLTLVIGASEAVEISRALRGEETPRPMTHALASQLLTELGGHLEELEIHDLQEGTYHAALSVTQEDRQMRIDCRPSDGVALALRAGAAIFVTDKVWAKAESGPEIS